MKPEEIFRNLRRQKSGGAALSYLEEAALRAWDAGERHEASSLLATADLVASGGLADSP